MHASRIPVSSFVTLIRMNPDPASTPLTRFVSRVILGYHVVWIATLHCATPISINTIHAQVRSLILAAYQHSSLLINLEQKTYTMQRSLILLTIQTDRYRCSSSRIVTFDCTKGRWSFFFQRTHSYYCIIGALVTVDVVNHTTMKGFPYSSRPIGRILRVTWRVGPRRAGCSLIGWQTLRRLRRSLGRSTISLVADHIMIVSYKKSCE